MIKTNKEEFIDYLTTREDISNLSGVYGYMEGSTYTGSADSTIHYPGTDIVYVDSMEDMAIVAAETRLKELNRMERMKKWKRWRKIDKIILLLVEMKVLDKKINLFEYIKLKGEIGKVIR